jgi:site-specific recombinase XerC
LLLKNVTFVRLPNGNRRLLDNDSSPIDAFNQFHKHMDEKLKLGEGTITIYGDDLAHFLDYMIEMKVFLSDVAPTRKELDEAVNAYPDYLANGVKSKNSYVAEIAKRIGGFKGVNADGHHIAAVNHFLVFAEQLAKDMFELAELVAGVTIDSPALVFSSLQGEVKMSPHEINRIRQNSVLGANLRQIKPWKKARLQSKNKSNQKTIDPKSDICLLQQTEDLYVEGTNMDFPLERFQELLENEPCPRNRALWALLGGGGLRQSEGVITYMPLVFPEEQIVRIVDPNDWRGSSKYKVPHRFKGRETAEVYIIPALRQIFFDSYLEWMKIRPLSNEYYVFLKHDKKSYAEPLHLATNTTLNKAFKKAQKRIGMTTLYTLHSLRHMYGVFMVNDFPTPWKTEDGLDVEHVQQLMGHACLESTKRYAKKKKSLLNAKMELGERMLMGESHLDLPGIIVKNLRDKANAIEQKAMASRKNKQ